MSVVPPPNGVAHSRMSQREEAVSPTAHQVANAQQNECNIQQKNGHAVHPSSDIIRTCHLLAGRPKGDTKHNNDGWRQLVIINDWNISEYVAVDESLLGNLVPRSARIMRC